jgi:hypothetical protein
MSVQILRVTMELVLPQLRPTLQVLLVDRSVSAEPIAVEIGLALFYHQM